MVFCTKCFEGLSPYTLSVFGGLMQCFLSSFLSTNHNKGIDLNLTAKYGGFDTTLYRYSGCHSTTMCEGVEELTNLMVSNNNFMYSLYCRFSVYKDN